MDKKASKKIINVGIVGGSGYTGHELLKILCSHKYSNVIFITSRSNSGKRIEEVFKNFKNEKYGSILFKKFPDEGDLKTADVLFLCLPPHSSMAFIRDIGENIKARVTLLAIPDKFIEQGSQEILRKLCGLTEENIIKNTKELLK